MPVFHREWELKRQQCYLYIFDREWELKLKQSYMYACN
jgi:hypothetical protein